MSEENGDAPKPPERQQNKENSATIKDGVMTVTIELEGPGASFAMAIGSLELSKDLVKNYFGQKAIAEAALRARSKIIRPNGAPTDVA